MKSERSPKSENRNGSRARPGVSGHCSRNVATDVPPDAEGARFAARKWRDPFSWVKKVSSAWVGVSFFRRAGRAGSTAGETPAATTRWRFGFLASFVIRHSSLILGERFIQVEQHAGGDGPGGGVLRRRSRREFEAFAGFARGDFNGGQPAFGQLPAA